MRTAAPAAQRWSPRRRAMLEAMGLGLWAPAAQGDAARACAHVDMPAGAPTPVPAQAPPVPPRAGVPVPPRVPAPAAPRDAAAAPSPGAAGGHAAAPAPSRADASRAPAARVPSAAEVAAMDWATLDDTVAGCVACPLAARRTRTVFGTGHREAHWMVIGEAPGEQEDLSGEPFVGASGRLLDRMLAALGLTRDAAGPERQVYIANTVKCRPPGNRNPEPAELAACEAYLARQIALVRPRVIVALGRVAAHWLLRTDEPLGRLRGRPHRYEGVPLVVTYHPAYLLRQAEDKARAWDDLCLAREIAAAQPDAAAVSPG